MTSRTWLVVALAGLFGGGLLSACGDDEGTSSGGRKGGEGDSCTRTDDCEAPLSCVDMVCTSGDATGGGGTGGTGGTGGAGGTGGGGDGGVGPGESLGPCDDCLDNLCVAALEACGSDCIAIEACLEATCRSIADQSEGQCQVACQSAHPAGEAAHLDVVNCAYGNGNIHSCQMGNPPACDFYPTDFQDCRTTMAAGVCKSLFDACNASTECSAYRSCTDACTTNSACQQCGATVEGQTGRQELIALETCIARECISESWLP